MQKTLGNGSATHLKILPVLTWLIIKTAYCMKSMAYRKNVSFQSLSFCQSLLIRATID